MARTKLRWSEYLIELLVVIIGISIAFSIENYAANRKEKGEELQHLKGLMDDLEKDAKSFEEFAGYVGNTLNYVRRLNELIRDKDVGNDSLNFLLLRAGWVSSTEPRSIGYNSLKTSGDLDKLSNFELRKSIVYHYEHKMDDIHFLNELHAAYLEKYVTPIQLKYSDYTFAEKLDRRFFDLRENRNTFAGLEGQLVNMKEGYLKASNYSREILELVKTEVSNF